MDDNTVAIIFLATLFYFLPAIIGRKKRNHTAITAFNFLLGWTVIGWIAALIWALTKDPMVNGTQS